MKKKILLFITVLSLISPLFFATVSADDFSAAAKYAIAVDLDSGKILYEKDSTTPASIASITKLLTVYLVYEAIEEGNITLDTRVDISDYPYQLTVESAVSNINLDTRSYSVEELLNASLISSANSAAIALAEKVAGSEPKFVDLMSAKLKEWGITDAKLVNTTGLNNSFLGDNIYPGSSENDENSMSALDVAIITRHLLQDYPQVTEITSKYSYTLEGNTYYSTNQMLSGGTYERDGVLGLKTGTTELSGASFVATTSQNGFQIITVVLNADNGDEYPDNRFLVTNNIMDYVYNNFTTTDIVKKGETFENSSVSVFNGLAEKSKAVAMDDLTVITRQNNSDAVSAIFKKKTDTIDASVKNGMELGTLTVEDTDLIGKGYLDGQPSVTMVAEKDIKTPFFLVSWWNHFVRYVNEKL